MNERIAQIAWESDILRFGHYTNASGAIVPFLPDPRWLFTNPKYLKVLGEELAKVITHEMRHINTLAGASTAGIPLAAVTALETGLEFIYVRKEGKGYSSNKTVEGRLRPGMVAVIIDDFNVIGKGKNMLIQNLWANGIGCRDALTVFDCECPMIEWYAENKVTVKCLLAMSDYFAYGLSHGYISKELHDFIWDAYKDNNLFKWQPEQEKWKQVMELARKEGFKFLGE